VAAAVGLEIAAAHLAAITATERACDKTAVVVVTTVEVVEKTVAITFVEPRGFQFPNRLLG
jgi:hypothetical protein